MRIPLVPLAVLVVLIGGAVTLFLLSEPPALSLGAPVVASLLDVEGTETEVAIAADGLRYALVASGDLWFVDLGEDRHVQLTDTPEAESAPAWAEAQDRITFTRGDDTLTIDPDTGATAPFLTRARDLTWGIGQVAFVRDRALWIAGVDGQEPREIVPADSRPDVTIRDPRFSPSGTQLMFIRTALNLHGEVWRVDLGTGNTFAVVQDRPAENPQAAEWIADDEHIVYLTDRGEGLAVWYVDLQESTLVPLTPPMMGRAVTRLGIDVVGNRIVVPHHALDSDIATVSGDLQVGGPGLHMEPALSRDGRRLAYTLENNGIYELWTLDRDTSDSRFVALGRHPRFSPDGNEIVYAATDLDGNRDIWKADVRTGLQEPLTDDGSIDDVPDWSPDGQSIMFTSDREGRPSVWTVPAAGGQRQRVADGAYAPRFSPDGSRIAFWRDGAVWTARVDGTDAAPVATAADPAIAVWSDGNVAFFGDGGIRPGNDGPIPVSAWPEFEALDSGDWLIASLSIGTTELWSVDLTFTEE